MLQLLAFLGALALLICNTAAGLASGLAGSLALAAAAILSALAQVTGFDRLDVFHEIHLIILVLCSLIEYHSGAFVSMKISFIFKCRSQILLHCRI